MKATFSIKVNAFESVSYTLDTRYSEDELTKGNKDSIHKRVEQIMEIFDEK